MVLMGLLAVWMAAYGYSLSWLFSPDPAATGLARFSGFFSWQAVAGTVAFACWGVGWSFPKDSGIRRVSRMPMGLALALLLVLAGLALFAG